MGYHGEDEMARNVLHDQSDHSLDNLLDFFYESLGSESTPIDNGNQVDDIVEPINREFDFLGFDAQHTSLDAPNVEVSASSTLGARPKRTLRPSRRPMDDQYDWDWDQV